MNRKEDRKNLTNPPDNTDLQNICSYESPIVSNEDWERISSFDKAYSTETLVILFTDIVGSTALKKKFGDHKAKELDDIHKSLLIQAIEGIPKAQIMSVEGDSYIFIFSRPADAVQFAVYSQMLHRETRKNYQPDLPEYRVGIHQGTVIVEDGIKGPITPGGIGDIRGLQADTTARVMGLAEGGQILCSRIIFDDTRQSLNGVDLENIGKLRWESYGLYMLKGLDDPFEVCEVGEVEFAPFIKPPGSEKARPVEFNEDVIGWRPGLETTLPGTNWVMEKKLGQGGFGEVWLAYDRTLKTVFKFCTNKARIKTLRREMEVFNALSARAGKTPPEIVEVIGTHDKEPPFYIQLAYAAGGDLSQWIEEKGKNASMKIKLGIAVQMAQSLKCIHNAGFVHRDIKPSNFLVEPEYEPGKAPVIKLTDFGIGQVAADAALGKRYGETGLPGGGVSYTLHLETVMDTVKGSLFFIAPELAGTASSPHISLNSRAGTAADIYSLGVTFYQLFAGDTGRIPISGLSAVKDPIIREDIKSCLDEFPENRPNADNLIQSLGNYNKRRAGRFRKKLLLWSISAILIAAFIFLTIQFKSGPSASDTAVDSLVNKIVRVWGTFESIDNIGISASLDVQTKAPVLARKLLDIADKRLDSKHKILKYQIASFAYVMTASVVEDSAEKIKYADQAIQAGNRGIIMITDALQQESGSQKINQKLHDWIISKEKKEVIHFTLAVSFAIKTRAGDKTAFEQVEKHIDSLPSAYKKRYPPEMDSNLKWFLEQSASKYKIREKL